MRQSDVALYGPAAVDHGARGTIRAGVIGTGETVQLALKLLEKAKGRVAAGQAPIDVGGLPRTSRPTSGLIPEPAATQYVMGLPWGAGLAASGL